MAGVMALSIGPLGINGLQGLHLLYQLKIWFSECFPDLASQYQWMALSCYVQPKGRDNSSLNNSSHAYFSMHPCVWMHDLMIKQCDSDSAHGERQLLPFEVIVFMCFMKKRMA